MSDSILIPIVLWGAAVWLLIWTVEIGYNVWQWARARREDT